MSMQAPADAKRLTCPACGRFLCTTDGNYVECAECKGCGAQLTIDLRKLYIRKFLQRPKRDLDTPDGRIEVK